MKKAQVTELFQMSECGYISTPATSLQCQTEGYRTQRKSMLLAGTITCTVDYTIPNMTFFVPSLRKSKQNPENSSVGTAPAD